MGSKLIGRYFFKKDFIFFFCVPGRHCRKFTNFFQVLENLSSFRDCSNIIFKGRVNDSLQILIIFTDILSQA